MKKLAFLSLIIFSGYVAYAEANYSASGDSMSATQVGEPPALSHELNDQLKLIRFQMREQGYYKQENDYAKFLMGLKNNQPATRLPNFIDEHGENDFIKEPEQLKVAVKKVFPSYIMKKEVLGATHLGSWVESKGGWSGYKIFFKQDKHTMCSYSYFDLSLSGGKVLPTDDKKEYIGTKESASEVIGDTTSGYVYSVSWFTPKTVKILDCAQAQFNKKELDLVKKYALLVDE